MIKVIGLPAFSDNYIWVIRHGDDPRIAVVDPGQAQPVLDYLDAHSLVLGAILITHHHPDHTGGVQTLLEQADVPVYGPAGERQPVANLSARLAQGDVVALDWLKLELAVISVPGHTAGHIAYHGADILFCGDTLFSGGCGKLFEGDAATMRASLAKLRNLPAKTHIYCGHEYTANNLTFAQAVEPDNTAITQRLNAVQKCRANNQPSLPSVLQDELTFNPFLRWDQASVIAAANDYAGKTLANADEVFATVRAWKDAF